MKLPLHDVYIVKREVEVPDECPKCKTNLLTKDALYLCEYVYQNRRMTCSKGQTLLEGPPVETPVEMDTFLSWGCAKCLETFVSSEHQELDADTLPAELLEMAMEKA